jgi:two-component system, LytTR family, sensor kinase
MRYSNHIIRFDKYAILLCIFFSILMPLYFVALAVLEDEKRSLLSTCYWVSYNASMTFTVSALLQLSNVYFIHYLEFNYPWKTHLKLRLCIEITCVFIYTILITTIVEFLFLSVYFHENFWRDLFRANVYALVLNDIVILCYEGIYVFKQWKKALIEAERLQKEHILFQYETLRSQVNPHFLFNNLNTLTAIVQKDPNQAVVFIKELSKVYRNILDYKDKLVINLEEELKLVDSFVYLQKIRFGDNLSISYQIPEDKLQELVPPFSLQLLIENAIKHNVASTKRPLHILIQVENNYLIVSNNLQKRNSENNSTGVGLKNLTNRYELISESLPEFVLTTDEYIAKIPLIQEN